MFVPAVTTSATSGRLFVVTGQALCVVRGERPELPRGEAGDGLYLGELDGEACFARLLGDVRSMLDTDDAAGPGTGPDAGPDVTDGAGPAPAGHRGSPQRGRGTSGRKENRSPRSRRPHPPGAEPYPTVRAVVVKIGSR